MISMKRIRIFFLLIMVIFLSTSYAIFLWSDNNTVLLLGKEDGVFEALTAIFFLVTSTFFFIKYIKHKEPNHLIILTTKRNIFFLLLSIVFFMGFGEEISWGQRIFNLQTPEFLEKINVQKEINIHNVTIFHGKTADGKQKTFFTKLLNIDRLFSIFWFSFCFLVPVLEKTNQWIRNVIKKINLPIIPIWIGSFFVLNYIFSKILENIINSQLHHSLVEIKECNIAFLFIVVSIYLYIHPSEARLVQKRSQ